MPNREDRRVDARHSVQGGSLGGAYRPARPTATNPPHDPPPPSSHTHTTSTRSRRNFRQADRRTLPALIRRCLFLPRSCHPRPSPARHCAGNPETLFKACPPGRCPTQGGFLERSKADPSVRSPVSIRPDRTNAARLGVEKQRVSSEHLADQRRTPSAGWGAVRTCLCVVAFEFR